eukprot:Tbor_TRINITY_DN5561_c2_g1::TRINITY_DN5561_c2_g1_i9::g.13096::m.13096/K02537/MAD2; mitotic spindle assembly checkpoint protein MAD2
MSYHRAQIASDRSFDLMSELLGVTINAILYYRKVYPTTSFEILETDLVYPIEIQQVLLDNSPINNNNNKNKNNKKNKKNNFGIIPVIKDVNAKEYTSLVLSDALGWLNEGSLEAIVIELINNNNNNLNNNNNNNTVLERWTINIESEFPNFSKDENLFKKRSTTKEECRKFIQQLIETVDYLPFSNCTSFIIKCKKRMMNISSCFYQNNNNKDITNITVSSRSEDNWCLCEAPGGRKGNNNNNNNNNIIDGDYDRKVNMTPVTTSFHAINMSVVTY